MTADEVRAMQAEKIRKELVIESIAIWETRIKERAECGCHYVHEWWGDMTCNYKHPIPHLTDDEKEEVIKDFKAKGFSVSEPRGKRSLRIAW